MVIWVFDGWMNQYIYIYTCMYIYIYVYVSCKYVSLYILIIPYNRVALAQEKQCVIAAGFWLDCCKTGYQS